MMKTGVFSILFIPFIPFISTGCTSIPSYHILVNGYAEGGADSTLTPGARVHVLGDENPDNPLLDQKLEKQLNRLLQEHGLKTAALDNDQKLALLFQTGLVYKAIGDKQKALKFFKKVHAADRNFKSVSQEINKLS